MLQKKDPSFSGGKDFQDLDFDDIQALIERDVPTLAAPSTSVPPLPPTSPEQCFPLENSQDGQKLS